MDRPVDLHHAIHHELHADGRQEQAHDAFQDSDTAAPEKALDGVGGAQQEIGHQAGEACGDDHRD